MSKLILIAVVAFMGGGFVVTGVWTCSQASRQAQPKSSVKQDFGRMLAPQPHTPW